jgi:hypothetical protein
MDQDHSFGNEQFPHGDEEEIIQDEIRVLRFYKKAAGFKKGAKFKTTPALFI